MTEDNKFIADLKAKGYVQGDLSTLPSDISDADRRKVEQYEADQANERMKATQGKKPDLQEFHVSLNPNQYGFAEQAAQGGSPMKGAEGKNSQTKRDEKPTTKSEPFGGKGDHDSNGVTGGAKKPA